MIKKEFDKTYILDTNILLEDATNIFKLSDENKNLIVLPETVLDEIDSKKTGFEEINFQAREFARILENSTILFTSGQNEYKIVRLKIENENNATVDIISKNDYTSVSKTTSLNIINDRRILEIAKFATSYYENESTFLSMDIMARTRAISLDIQTQSLVGSNKDELIFEFIKKIEINFEDLEHIENTDIDVYDKEYKVNNYSYCFKVRGSDQILLASIQNGKIRLLDEGEVRNQIIAPLNTEQLFFSNAILQHYFNVLIVEAKAGSGKTLLALSGALKLVRNKEYQRIIYIRNSIESLDKGEDVGYLPGLEEKFKIYNHPLMDSLDHIVRTEYKKRRAKKNKEY